MRRDFRKNDSRNDAVAFHRTQTICQDFLTDAFKILFLVIEAPWTNQQISEYQ